jgi:BirA family biotin operon repressor/biotin-[acetyl-CoA-carboxylase] ligase
MHLVPNTFSMSKVEAELELLGGSSFAGHIHHVVSTPSTNTLALEAAAAGEATGVWVADEQTAGRGRGGHAWFSTPGDGLYVSILVRPRLSGTDTLKLSFAAGLAATRAVAGVCNHLTDIRWPNDLMIDQPDGSQRKFGGILTESSIEGGTGALAYAVIGVGVNLNQRSFPPELSHLATSLLIDLGQRVSRERFLAKLLTSLESELNLLNREVNGTLDYEPGILERFERSSSRSHNHRVHVDEEGGYTGSTAGLDQNGLLLILLDDGSIRTVRHGGVREIS